MTFEWPLALLALLVVPALVVLYVRRERRRNDFAKRFANPALLPNLVPRPVGRKRHVPLALLLLALSTMLVGVARPHATVSVPREEATIVRRDRRLDLDDLEGRPADAARRGAPSRARVRPRRAREVPRRPRVVRRSRDPGRAADRRPQRVRAGAHRAEARAKARRSATRSALSVDLARRAGQRSDRPPPAAIVVVSDGAQTVGRVQAPAAARRARALNTPVYTVVLGTPNGTIERTLVGGFKESHARSGQPRRARHGCARVRREVLRRRRPRRSEARLRGARLAARHAQGRARDHRLLLRRRGAVPARRGCALDGVVPEGPVRRAIVLLACAATVLAGAGEARATNECRGLMVCVRSPGRG